MEREEIENQIELDTVEIDEGNVDVMTISREQWQELFGEGDNGEEESEFQGFEIENSEIVDFREEYEDNINNYTKQVQNVLVSEACKFWSGIWATNQKHDETSNWIGNIKEELKGIEKQEELVLEIGDVKDAIRKMTN